MFVLSAENALMTKLELRVEKHDCHGLYYDGMLLKCARTAGLTGLLNWE